MPLSASQLVADACSVAKCPGFTAQGGRALNLVLSDLVLHRNLKMNCVAATITATAGSTGPYTLESDYLRSYELYYLISGEPQFLDPVALRTFDQDNNRLIGTGYPNEYATDLSPQATQSAGLLYIYPPPNTQLSLTHRYFLQRADITTPETNGAVPWFPDQDYLIQATAARLMRITDDQREPAYVQRCEQMLRLHLMTEGDEQQVVKSVQLDPRRFRVAGGVRPTKLDPY